MLGEFSTIGPTVGPQKMFHKDQGYIRILDDILVGG